MSETEFTPSTNEPEFSHLAQCPSCGDIFDGAEGCRAALHDDEPEVLCCIPCAEEINAGA